MFELVLMAILLQSPAGESSPPEQLYAEATVAMENGDWAVAIEKLEAILSGDPSHVASRFNLAVSYGEAGQIGLAVNAYRALLADDPTVFEARMNLAILLNDGGNLEEAAEEFAAGAALRPEDPLPSLYRAQLLDQIGRTDAAIAAYRAVVDIDPSLAEPYERLGLLYRRTDQAEAAVRELEMAAQLGTLSPAVFVALGDIEFERGDMNRAGQHYQRASQLAADDSEILLRLALALREQGLLPDAIGILEDLEDVDVPLAEAYLANEDFPNAAAVYERLTVAHPDNADYWFLLGSSRYEAGRATDAERALEQALRLQPERVSGWGLLATIYLEREDWRNAGITLSQYVGLEPDHAPSHFLLGLCFDNLGDFENALVHYNRFIEFDDGSDDVRSFQVRQRVETLERSLGENR